MSNENQPGQAGEEQNIPEGSGFDPSSYEVDVGGRRMTIENLQKSYLEAENRMRESDNKVAEYSRKLEDLSWAPEFMSEYTNNQDLRRAVDDYYGGGGNQAGGNANLHGLHPLTQELNQLKQQQAMLVHERQFDQLRGDGYEVSKDDELKVLREIATNPNVQDVRAAYAMLFSKREIERAREAAQSQTLENMEKSRGTYKVPPKGKSSSAAKPDIRSMSEAERDAYAVERLRELFD